MFTRSRYIHQPMPWASKHNGFSVQLTPHLPHSLVGVRYTICNKKDQFSRKQARIELESKPYDRVEILKLPEFLEQLERKTWGIHDWKNVPKHGANNWTWVWKYFL